MRPPRTLTEYVANVARMLDTLAGKLASGELGAVEAAEALQGLAALLRCQGADRQALMAKLVAAGAIESH